AATAARVFQYLDAVVVDELHSFIGAERGRQLQSLMARIDTLLARRVRRIALSATLGDMRLAAQYLRPGAQELPRVIHSSEEGPEVLLQVRAYRAAPPRELGASGSGKSDTDAIDDNAPAQAIASHIFSTLRLTASLVFANRRHDVEYYADTLREMCEAERVPNSFVPHHGNLSRDLREDAEERLRAGSGESDLGPPTTVVCTSTLELGIDVGAISQVAQIGVPHSVASMRQRLGRSGRRGQPAVMRMYITEADLTTSSPLMDRLRPGLVQTIASVNLLLDNWCEPPCDSALHLSTLVQQALSLLAEYGALTAIDLHRLLCEAGPFRNVSAPTFAAFLRSLAQNELIKQCHDSTIVLDLRGEKLVSHYSFYSAFSTPDEYRLFTSGKLLGTLPIAEPQMPGSYMVYAGRRWHVVAVDEEHHVIDLTPAGGGRVPRFAGSGSWVDGRVREAMRLVYLGGDEPRYLNGPARTLLTEGRANFVRSDLGGCSVVPDGTNTIVFPWASDRIGTTIRLLLVAQGPQVTGDGFALTVHDTVPAKVTEHLISIADAAPLDPAALVAAVENKMCEKHDRYLSEELLQLDYSSRFVDVPAALATIRGLLVPGSGGCASPHVGPPQAATRTVG
ncbi:MAG: helicase-related protein, partial [Armatimonadetes bacterium]|nr:helicase-related protein [Armatimonadota bacterium]